RTYYFCNPKCRDKFSRDPERYLVPPAPTPAAQADAEYTCPMHPDVIQRGPGDCPKCGMALEPKTVSVEAPPELTGLVRRFWICAVLSAPVLILAMSPGLAHRTMRLQALLSMPVVVNPVRGHF